MLKMQTKNLKNSWRNVDMGYMESEEKYEC